jgi:hypothetical protein
MHKVDGGWLRLIGFEHHDRPPRLDLVERAIIAQAHVAEARIAASTAASACVRRRGTIGTSIILSESGCRKCQFGANMAPSAEMQGRCSRSSASEGRREPREPSG